MRINYLVISMTLFISNLVFAQKSLLYENLPVGKYAVGFKIITIIDDSRVVKPEYRENYLKNRNEV